MGLQHLPWMIHFAKRDLKTTILCILRECILYFPGSRHSQWGDGGLHSPTSMCDCQSKRPNFPSQSLTVGASSERPPPVNDRDHFLGLTVNGYSLFLTSCERPLNSVFDLYFRCVHYVTKNIRRTLVTTWNYTYPNLNIACNKWSSIK